MNLSRMPKATLATVAAVACVTLSGCLVSAPPPARPIAYVDEPVYYDGYAVRYDVVAAPDPYYPYPARAPRYVQRNHPRHDDSVRHRSRRYRTY